MKRIFVVSIQLLLLLATNSSCDKVENPIKPSAELDSTLYPGDWNDYVVPVFSENNNTQKNVLIEDYTGHLCGNCPDAATAAKSIEDANPGRVFVASVHSSPTGLSAFQEQAFDCGTSSNPNDKYCTIFYCDEGLEYGETFGGGGFGFVGNPQGNVNRKEFGNDPMFQNYGNWASLADQIITNNDLKINIQAKSNYYSETNAVFLHTEVDFVQSLEGSYNQVVYLIENEVVDYQLDGTSDISDYHHHNILRACLNNDPWGRAVDGGTSSGDKSYLDYSYQLPDGKTNNDYHLLIYVYDTDTYEIIQVIKHQF